MPEFDSHVIIVDSVASDPVVVGMLEGYATMPIVADGVIADDVVCNVVADTPEVDANIFVAVGGVVCNGVFVCIGKEDAANMVVTGDVIYDSVVAGKVEYYAIPPVVAEMIILYAGVTGIVEINSIAVVREDQVFYSDIVAVDAVYCTRIRRRIYGDIRIFYEIVNRLTVHKVAGVNIVIERASNSKVIVVARHQVIP